MTTLPVFHTSQARTHWIVWGAALAALLPVATAAAATPCGAPTGPDLVVEDIAIIGNYANVGTIDAFSAGPRATNVGTASADWVPNTNSHPIIAQQFYRLHTLSSGVTRIEQIGMSWVTHLSIPLALGGLCTCSGSSANQLQPGCTDVVSSSTTGFQGYPSGGLGPRNEINATTGAFPYPYTFRGMTGDSVYKRLQVNVADLETPPGGSANFYYELQYVSPDEAAAGNINNNVSHRGVFMAHSGNNWSGALIGAAQREAPAIMAWGNAVPTVEYTNVDVPEVGGDTGRVIVAVNVVDLGGGMWNYEYAVYNMNSDRSVGSVALTVGGAAVSNIGFHDADYHSGDGVGSTEGNPYNIDGADWAGAANSGDLTWATAEDFNTNPNGNAIRWGTTYNFRFDAAAPPKPGTITLGLFKPGSPDSIEVNTLVPDAPANNGDFDGDGDVDLTDFAVFSLCFGGPNNPPAASCPDGGTDADFDNDGDVDLGDFATFSLNFTGPL